MMGEDLRRLGEISITQATQFEEQQRRESQVLAGGRFEHACAALVKQGFDPLYVELWTEAGEKTRKTKAASKTRYSCPDCGTNAWAKPDVHLVCGECDERMEAD
jgi:hypothetical protein